MTRYRHDPDLGGTRRLLDGRLPADMPTTDPRASRTVDRRAARRAARNNSGCLLTLALLPLLLIVAGLRDDHWHGGTGRGTWLLAVAALVAVVLALVVAL